MMDTTGKYLVSESGNSVRLYKQCSVTNEAFVLTVDAKLFDRYIKTNDLIQDIFPDLSSNQREFIISGTTPAEWDKMFKYDEDE